MMDHEIRRSGLAGNFCAIILELQGRPDIAWISEQCRQFGRRFPQAVARLQSKGRQFEWSSRKDMSLPLYEHQSTALNHWSSSDKIIEDIVNRSMPPSDAAPVEIHIIEDGDRSQLVLRWFHPVCDAKGAELVLHHLLQGPVADHGDSTSAILQLMRRWSLWQKIKLAYKAKKNIQQLDQHRSILPETQPSVPDRVKIKTLRFEQDDSANIMKLARQQTGLTGTSLYFIGCMMRALEQTGSETEGDAYCVPYAMNLRKRKSLFPVFGNQVSFLFAQASRETVRSRHELFTVLREQNKNAIKQGLDRAMLPLMQAGSWLPLEKYGNIVRYSPEGRERSSFWFSYTGSMDPEPESVQGCPVTGVYQFSQVTSPPSLGLLVNLFDSHVILSFNYVASQFKPEWMDQLMMNMKAELLNIDTDPI